MVAVAPFSPRPATTPSPTSAAVPLLLRPFSSPSSSPSRITIAAIELPRLRPGPRSSLASPRLPARRKNHLRDKFLRTLTLEPANLPPSPPPALVEEFNERVPEGIFPADDQLVLLPAHGDEDVALLKEEEVEEVVVRREDVGDPLLPAAAPAAEHLDVPKLLLQLSLYLGGLLAVQTVCAMLLFGGAVSGGTASTAVASSAKKGSGSLWWGREARKESFLAVDRGYDLEFDSKVEEIRAMAREARLIEAKELADEDGNNGNGNRVQEEVNRKLKRLTRGKSQVVLMDKSSSSPPQGDKNGKYGFREKLELREIRAAMGRKAPEGFSGRKNSLETSSSAATGDNQQIRDDELLQTAPEMQKKSTEDDGSMTGSLFRSKGSTVSTSKDSLGVSDRKGFPIEDGERLGSSRGTSISGVNKPHLKSASQNGHASSQLRQGSKKVKFKSKAKKGYNQKHYNQSQYWWSKLPYVLAICMQRGLNGSSYKGLYTLKMDPHSDDRSSPLTIVFEDRSDATNVCYLLESFFEELGDVTADVIPMTIHELEEAVKTKSLNVIVVPRGKLHLYAGQPLSEVETALRSLLDRTSQGIGE